MALRRRKTPTSRFKLRSCTWQSRLHERLHRSPLRRLRRSSHRTATPEPRPSRHTNFLPAARRQRPRRHPRHRRNGRGRRPARVAELLRPARTAAERPLALERRTRPLALPTFHERRIRARRRLAAGSRRAGSAGEDADDACESAQDDGLRRWRAGYRVPRRWRGRGASGVSERDCRCQWRECGGLEPLGRCCARERG